MFYLFVALLMLSACGGNSSSVLVNVPTSAPTNVPTGIPTSASPPSTVASTAAPTATLAPTATPAPTIVPTAPPTATPAPTAEALRYVFPVKATRYDVSPSHHDYPAADIACPIGSEFLAPVRGVVDYVSREDIWRAATNKPADRGGLSVAIVGDDGVRYYGSHLSEVAQGIEPGVRVAAGQVLGLTGESGNAQGVYPQLHFGISHPTKPDDWAVRRGEIAPQTYLKAWERGENMTPIITR